MSSMQLPLLMFHDASQQVIKATAGKTLKLVNQTYDLLRAFVLTLIIRCQPENQILPGAETEHSQC